MNSKRRAELQRKLSLDAVPRPPAGLSDRIKADIPKYLDTAAERTRFSSAVAFNMRIAASVLLAVLTLVVTVYVVNSPVARKEAAGTTPGPFPPSGAVLPQPQVASSTTSASAQAQAQAQEVRLDSARDAAVPVPIAAMTPPPALPARSSLEVPSPQPEARVAEEQEALVGSVMRGAVGGVEGGVTREAESDVATMADRVEPRTFAPERDAAPAPAPMAAPPPPAAIAESSRARTERTPASLGLARPAEAKTLMQSRGEVFGISVDPDNFHRIRQTLESGGRPLPSAVDVEAIVNYFAGAAEKRPKRGVRLDVEASPAPIEADGDHAVLRFSIDTPDGAGAPIASDVRLEILFNNQVVANARRVGGNEPLPAQSMLPHGTSVTGLYALELRPNLLATQLVATVRLHYTTVATGKAETLTKHVRGRDLANGWQHATRRHRLASLGALWGESMKNSSGGVDVARRAEELATQDPQDALARELAEAASASSGGGR